MAECMEQRFESIGDFLLPTVLKLTTRANRYHFSGLTHIRVYVSCATSTLKTCIESAGQASMIPILVDSLKTPSKSLRLAAMDCIVLIAKRNDPEKLLPWLNLIEKTISEAVVDPTPEVRDLARGLFELYKVAYPGTLTRFQDALPDMAKKYLKLDIGRRLSKGGSRSTNLSASTKLSMESISKKPRETQPKRPPVISKISALKSEESGAATQSKSQSDIATPILFEPKVKKSQSVDTLKPLSKNGSLLPLKKPEKASRSTNLPPEDTPRAPLRAQRVARQPVNLPAGKIMKPAQRVVSNSAVLDDSETISGIEREENIKSSESLVSQKTNSSIFSSQTKLLMNSNASKSRIAAMKATEGKALKKTNSAIQLEKAADLAKLMADFQNTDWAIRTNVFEAIEKLYSAYDRPNDFNTPNSEKTFRLILEGLADGHFKVILAALGSVMAFVDSNDFPVSKLDMVLPKIAGAAFNPLQKTKSVIIEKAKGVVDRIVSRVPPAILGQSLSNCLGNPSLSGKMRIGLVGFVHSLSISTLSLSFAKSSSIDHALILACRSFVSRMAPFALDQDPNVLMMIKAIMMNLWQLYPDYLSQGLANIHYSERDALFALTGKEFKVSQCFIVRLLTNFF
jgi:hypothetical protein